MLIPVRCVTCGNILGSKYKLYKEIIAKKRQENPDMESDIMNFKGGNTTIYSTIMEKVGVKRYCCKRHFLGQQEILRVI
jgi:DNA-directed RNA polymerase subunit N (RpoN/RPB10)